MDEIQSIEFCLLCPDTIKNFSQVEIVHHELFDKNVPKVGGLNDLRMGTIDKQYLCKTCNGDVLVCPGHFGHIELTEPIFHISYMKIIHKILSCICFHCHNLLSYSKPLKFCFESSKSKVECEYCKQENEKLVFDNYKICKKDKVLSAKTCLELLKNISDEDYSSLGFNIKQSHPKNMIFTILPVCPPQVRPSIIMDASLRSQDDLTHKFSEIVKVNNSLLKRDLNQTVKEELVNLIQFHVNTLIDNGIPGLPQATHRTGRPIKSISQRLKAKEGRIRGNLMGKRVDFSARSVITADTTLNLDELGVPFSIASNLTFPEKVTQFNIKWLQDMVNFGPKVNYGQTGAKYVHTETGTKDLRFIKKDNIKLNIGDTVDRHLIDGDYVVFNRQPSLHKMSMMGHKVKILPGNTFRINLSATTPYNADFDGDEMNMHVPQSLNAKSEIKELMMIENNIVSPQSNKPVIGIIQDALLSCFKLTNKDIFIDYQQFCNILLKVKGFPKHIPSPAIIKPKALWTGKQLIQTILPRVSYQRWNCFKTITDSKNFSFNDGYVCIRNGTYISGNLCKKTLGTSECSLIHHIWLLNGPKTCKQFISNIQYVANYWLVDHGFSVGAMDIFTQVDSTPIIEEAMTKVKHIVALKNFNEQKVNQLLNNAMSVTGKAVISNLDVKNNIYSTVTGGSKGSINNIAQIMGCVGQQNIGGGRISVGYNNRVLPHFEKNDKSALAKGFVANSYLKGLSPNEFFFHAMSGREGIIDTAIKTSESGYIQRKLVKSMEDLKICFDFTVRNSIGDIIQFSYGDDNMDASKLQTLNISIEQFFIDECKNLSEKEELIYIKKNCQKTFVGSICVDNFKNHKKSTSLETPDWYFKKLKNLLHSIKKSTIHYESTINIRNYLKCELCSSKTIYEKIGSDDYLKILDSCFWYFRQSLIQPGVMVGTISAQSLGELTTQLTLNTFHSAGISSKNVTLGVPRLKEILNYSKNIKSPGMEFSVKNNHSDTIASQIEKFSLVNCVKSTSVVERKSLLYSDEFIDHIIEYHIDVLKLKNKSISLIDICVSLMETFNKLKAEYNIETSKIYVYLLKSKDTVNLTIDEIYLLIDKIKHEFIRGDPLIDQVFTKGNEIETNGSSLENILQINNINHNSIYSNNLSEIIEYLGIEAARAVLIKELKKVIEFDGSYVNNRHFTILADTMTYKGSIMPISRHGVNKTATGPLKKCSFEETVDVLIAASTYGVKDNLKGVTENITVGKLPKLGTGNIDLLISKDTDLVQSYFPDYINEL